MHHLNANIVHIVGIFIWLDKNFVWIGVLYGFYNPFAFGENALIAAIDNFGLMLLGSFV